jgi:hypothetical protein
MALSYVPSPVLCRPAQLFRHLLLEGMSTLGRYSWHLDRIPWIGFDLNASTNAAFGSADRSGSAFCSSR